MHGPEARVTQMQLAGYEILRELGSRSLLARDRSGRAVVLKSLPPDCLLEGQLNPNIAERLRRVREIAMTDVANLRGVEREGDRIFLVWDFVEGVPFDQAASDSAPLARELAHTVDRFHATGLVHGALHNGNVLVDSTGRIRLIDVSPLLFLDPGCDELAVQQMLANLRQKQPQNSAQLVTPPATLRRRTLFAALVTLLLGVSVGLAIDRMVRRSHPAPLTPPRISR